MKNTVFNWRDAPRQTANTKSPKQTKPFNGLRAATNHPNNITVVGAAQGSIDAHRRDSIKRGASI